MYVCPGSSRLLARLFATLSLFSACSGVLSACSWVKVQTTSTHRNGSMTPNNPSPFQSGKVALQSSSLELTVEGSKTDGTLKAVAYVPTTLSLVAIVDEECRIARRAAGESTFIDAQVPAPQAEPSGEKIHRVAYRFSLDHKMNLESLRDSVADDPCVVGISQESTATVSGSAVPISDYARNYFNLSDIGLTPEIDNTLATDTANMSVIVGVIDTGIDFGNRDVGQISASIDGTNRIEISTPPQDPLGHGTQVASIIGGVGEGTIRGVAPRVVRLAPIRVAAYNPDTDEVEVSNYVLHDAIVRAVNLGAEVINLSVSGVSHELCDPVVGEAIYKALEKGAFFVIAAGNGIKYATDPLTGRRVGVPGVVASPKDNGPAIYTDTAIPSCWGRYFKGAVAVASTTRDGKAVSKFSNWGANSIELAAPGEMIPAYGLKGQVVTASGTSMAAPQVSAAVALMIAYHKAQKWPYSPWLLEDILVNASEDKAELSDKVRLGKFLNIGRLAGYLHELKAKTETERREESGDNPDQGTGTAAPPPTQGAPKPVQRLEVATKTPIIQNTARGQVNAVAYYADGTLGVVTEQTTWVSSNPAQLTIDSHGVVYPAAGFVGSATITGTFGGKTTALSVSVVNINTTTGAGSAIVGVRWKMDFSTLYDWLVRGLSGTVEAFYEDGSARDVIRDFSFSSSDPSIFSSPYQPLINPTEETYGGRSYTFSAAYEGKSSSLVVTLPKLDAAEFRLSFDGDGVYIPPDRIVSRTFKTTEKIRLIATLSYFKDAAHTQKSYPKSIMNYHVVVTGPDGNVVWEAQPSEEFKRTIDPANFAPGLYQLEATKIYKGAGTDQPISYKTNFTIIKVARVLSNIGLRFDSEEAIPSTNPQILFGWRPVRLGVRMAYSDGTGEFRSDLSGFKWTVTDRQGVARPDFWIGISRSSYYLYAYNADPSTGVRITLKEPLSGVSTTVDLATVGLTSYTSPTSDPLPVPTVTMTPKADDSYCASGSRATQDAPAGGTGTASDPYLICNPQQLRDIELTALQGVRPPPPHTHYRLMKNLDFASIANWVPLKLNAPIDLDGNGYEIQNLTTIDSEKNDRGLIGQNLNGYRSVFRNLGFRNPVVRAKYDAGALMGYNGTDVLISNVYTIGGQIWAYQVVGGLVGDMGAGGVVQSYSFGTKIVTENGDAGGLIGTFHGSFILSSFATGDIESVGVPANSSHFGGLVGEVAGRINWPYTSSYITHMLPFTKTPWDWPTTATPEAFLAATGGAGDYMGLIRNCHATGNVKSNSIGNGVSAGGLVGAASGAIVRSYATGDVVSAGSGVGGLVGTLRGFSGYDLSALIDSSYASGNVWGGNDLQGQSKAGGLVGYSLNAFIQNSESRGVVNGTESTGGLIGEAACFQRFVNAQSKSRVESTSSSAGAFIGRRSPCDDTRYVNDVYVNSFWNAAESIPAIGRGANSQNVMDPVPVTTGLSEKTY